ncbi:MAG: fumarylacetoacetate hydrolase family protein [Sphingomonadales bacterium]
MKLVSFRHQGRQGFGALAGDGVVDLTRRLGDRHDGLKQALRPDDLANLRVAADGLAADLPLDAVELLPPVPDPGKILCIGVNYEMHREETGRAEVGHPTVFTRFADTLVGQTDAIVVPKASRQLDFEGELAVVIGLGGRGIARDRAFDHVAGYSCFNDATVRDWQRHTSQFTPGKNFPATGGFGPWLVTADEISDIKACAIKTTLNGEVMQQAKIDQLIFPIPELIHYISTFTELRPGDVICTGTPGGVGSKRNPPRFLKPGDRFTVEIEGVGVLVNRVEAEN